MTIKKIKKNNYKNVDSTIVENTLAYVTDKFGLTSDYLLTGFKMGKNSIEIKVRNNDVECSYNIINPEIMEKHILPVQEEA